MNLATLRHPGFAAALACTEPPEPAAETPAPETEPAPAVDRVRTRFVTLSPAEEYARRAGETEPIPDALAAMILSKKTRVQVTGKGVKITHKDWPRPTTRKFWHADSALCNDLAQATPRQVWAIWNPQDLSCIHLLDDAGRYLETLPAEELGDFMDAEKTNRLLADQRRQINRMTAHLEALHAPDIDAEIERTAHNHAEMLRAVTVQPAALPMQPGRIADATGSDRNAETPINNRAENYSENIPDRTRADADADDDLALVSVPPANHREIAPKGTGRQEPRTQNQELRTQNQKPRTPAESMAAGVERVANHRQRYATARQRGEKSLDAPRRPAPEMAAKRRAVIDPYA